MIVDLVWVCDIDLELNDPQVWEILEPFVESYNEVISEYCDSFFRHIESAEVIAIGRRTITGNLSIQLSIVGSCLG